MSNKAFRFNALSCAVLALASGAAGAQNGFSLSAGLTHSSGDYGTATTTKITTIPIVGQYETGPWKLKLTVPYVRVEGNANVLPGSGRVTTLNPTGRARGGGTGAGATSSGTDQGLGDIVASATHNTYYDTASRFGIDLTGKIKFGTASAEKGLGTGENDYSVGIDAFKSISNYTIFGGFAYTQMGDSGTTQLNNVFSANLGALYPFSDRLSGGLSLDFREQVSAGAGAQRELTLFVSHNLAANWKAQGYVLKGFADGSPNWGIGASAQMMF